MSRPKSLGAELPRHQDAGAADADRRQRRRRAQTRRAGGDQALLQQVASRSVEAV